MVLQINGTNVVNTDRSITLGTATPGAPVTGMMRYNSTLPEFQVYDGAAWVPFKKVVGGSAATLYAWGNNTGTNSGALGDNSVLDKSSPVSVVGGFTDWVEVSGGQFHSLAIRANGTLWAWGRAAAGPLGDNSIVEKSSPVSVVGGIVDWVTAAGGGSHSLAIRANGTLYAWGTNGNGQLGDNSATTASKSSPVVVAGGFTDWISISASTSHSLGLRANGTIWTWGSNASGLLGDNSATTASKSSPVQVAGNFVNCNSISAGTTHNIIVRTDGTAWAWGANSYGRLGDNTTVSKSSPVQVAGGIVNWKQVTAGQHSLGVRANGTLYAWGPASAGQLGDNSNVPKSSPVLVAGGFTDWVSTVANSTFQASLGLRANGTLWSWGFNLDGQLGNGSTQSASSPVSVVGGFTDWVSIGGGGGSHMLGIRG